MAEPPPFDKRILNFRDVGAHINSIVESPILKPGLLFRSARLDEASSTDRDHLVHRYKIRTVIDLRSKTELINAAKKHDTVDGEEVGEGDTPQVQMASIRYANINLNGKGFERYLIWQLKYWSLIQMIVLMVLGYRTQAIAILGKELMLPRGLVGLGKDTLDHSGPEIREMMNIVAKQDSWPVLIHCTQGKDRTGITILLLLLLCGIDIEAISHDYLQSESELECEKEARMEEIASIGLDESFAGCPVDFCHQIHEHLGSRYGGVEEYMRTIGVEEEQCSAVQEILKVGGTDRTKKAE
ncbi:hypothetical protein PV10_02035 [Exophiala mesophila]|uniref:Tyrosine specific protein phosphatases domain-containing protein n=1 Tax=Exophiala mesophila TaxID=212818 RepID=A0A0D1Y147_EXOME|nr:uncharacterized protein PV10_02035 [Exophiala mesophila]KIV94251.1 hypothetical protein PV10_02035 [Exophiala mesophila]